MRLIPFMFFIPFLLISCKTSEQIRRERMVDEISEKVIETEKNAKESQRHTGDLTLRMQNLEDRMNQIQGTQEENQHFHKEANQGVLDRLNKIEERLKTVDEQLLQMSSLSQQAEEQKAYLEKVLKTLESVQKDLQKDSSKGKKKDKSESKSGEKTSDALIQMGESTDSFDLGMKLFRNGQYDKARPILEELVNQKDLPANKVNRIMHNLGVIDYQNGNHETALVYFSKIYTKYPASSFSPNSLLHIGKILQKIGKTEEARQALSDLIKKYPQSARVEEAKGLLDKMK